MLRFRLRSHTSLAYISLEAMLDRDRVRGFEIRLAEGVLWLARGVSKPFSVCD